MAAVGFGNPYTDNRLRNLYFNAPAPQTMQAPKRSLTQRTSDAVADLAAKVLPKGTAKRVASLADLNPVTPAFDAGADLRKGNYLQGSLGALLSLMPDGGAAAAKGGLGVLHSIIAPLWHGSPHKFEKFALEKIGTGEGAQAYGHGLYFAENKAVAEDYQKGVLNMPLIQTNNARMAELAKQMEGLAVPGQYRKFRDPKGYEMANEYDRLMAEKTQPGHLYQVKLDANPEDFLDWDSLLNKQPAPVANAVREVAQPARYGMPEFGADDYRNTWREMVKRPDVTSNLASRGVAGIRYLDQGSRAAGDGSRNYVVFDPSIIDITDRY